MYKDNEPALKIIYYVFLMTVLLCLAGYYFAFVENGFSTSDASVQVGDVNFIFPVPNTPSCEYKEMSGVLKERIITAGLLGESRTEYYLVFGNYVHELDANNSAEINLALTHTDESLYRVLFCNGKLQSVEKIK